MGNHGLNEIIVNDINQAPEGGADPLNLAAEGGVAAAPVRVPYASFGTIAGILPWATSDYDGLQAKVEKRFSQGLYLLESFTWSKAIDIAAQALDGGGNCAQLRQRHSLGAEYLRLAGRPRHLRLQPPLHQHHLGGVVAASRQGPVAAAQRQPRRWTTSSAAGRLPGSFRGAAATRSILPIARTPTRQVSPLTSVDGRNSYRPNISGPAIASNKSYHAVLQRGELQHPASGASSGSTMYNSFGNMPRNSVRGYDYWDVDMGLSKDFALTERFHLQLRAESFNLFNHTNFSDPNTIVPNTGTALVPGQRAPSARSRRACPRASCRWRGRSCSDIRPLLNETQEWKARASSERKRSLRVGARPLCREVRVSVRGWGPALRRGRPEAVSSSRRSSCSSRNGCRPACSRWPVRRWPQVGQTWQWCSTGCASGGAGRTTL